MKKWKYDGTDLIDEYDLHINKGSFFFWYKKLYFFKKKKIFYNEIKRLYNTSPLNFTNTLLIFD